MGEILATWKTTLGLGPQHPTHHLRLVLTGRDPLRYALEREEKDAAGAPCWVAKTLEHSFNEVALIRGVLQAGRFSALLARLGEFPQIVAAHDELKARVERAELYVKTADGMLQREHEERSKTVRDVMVRLDACRARLRDQEILVEQNQGLRTYSEQLAMELAVLAKKHQPRARRKR